MAVAVMKEDFLTRVKSGVRKKSMFGQMSVWMQENVILNDRPFSFKDHEFQIQIADETRPMVCKKVAQVGLSQISAQKAIGFTALTRGKHLIYVMPSAVFAVGFSKSRVDPIINASPNIRAKVNAGVDSAKLKQIGTSFLHFGGAANMSQVISIPAEALIVDEYNFCDPTVVTAYESRLGHAEGGGTSSRFSTPTLPDFGVSREIVRSTWARYLVKCPSCYEEVAPIFSEHVRIPGFDRPFSEFDAEAVELLDAELSLAYIACPSCGGELDSALKNASKRRWVEQFPGRTVAGYDVRPFDLYKYNPTSTVLRKISKYSVRQDYYNFALGEDFQSDEAQILPENVASFSLVGPDDLTSIPLQMGVDVGKTCHYIVGAKVDGQYLVKEVGRLNVADGDLKHQILRIADKYDVTDGVIDALPDTNLSHTVHEEFGGSGVFYPAYYSETNDKNYNYWAVNEKEKFVLINRSKACQQWVEKVNSGRVLWPKYQAAEMDIVKLQLPNMKRVKNFDTEEDDSSGYRWIKASGNDHYFHTGIYFMAAADRAGSSERRGVSVAPVSVRGAAVGSRHLETQESVTSRLISRALGLR